MSFQGRCCQERGELPANTIRLGPERSARRRPSGRELTEDHLPDRPKDYRDCAQLLGLALRHAMDDVRRKSVPDIVGNRLSGAPGSACAIVADKTSCCSIFSTPGSGSLHGNTVSLSFPGTAPSSEAFNKSSRFLIPMGPTASLDVIAIFQVIETSREGADGPGDKSHGIVALVRRRQGW
jgi:hypothetical protein